MAWAAVANSSVWQYENTATASNTYSDAPGVYNAGVRTFTYAGGNTRKTYARCRKVGETIERGELSWDYFDAQG